MTVNTPIPPIREVVAQLRSSLCGETHDAGIGLMVPVLALLRSNQAQWELENVTRDPSATDADVAGAKRAIDRLNLQRHGLVEDIDAILEAAMTQSVSAPLATESPGMALDRLSVLAIRIAHTEAVALSDAADAAGYAARLPVLERQLSALSSAIEVLLRDVQAGVRRFVVYEHLKLYAP
jgi:Protein of unknown function (DUF4254)